MKIQNQLDQWFEKVLLAIKKFIQQKKGKQVFFTGCPKNRLILVQKMGYMDVIKILGLLKSFVVVMRSICGSILKKRIDRANKFLF